jgi:hypothetical protein
VQKLIGFVTQLTKGDWQIVSTQTVDTLQAQKERLEKNLVVTPPQRTSPSKVKLAELQKFMDLAG